MPTDGRIMKQDARLLTVDGRLGVLADCCCTPCLRCGGTQNGLSGSVDGFCDEQDVCHSAQATYAFDSFTGPVMCRWYWNQGDWWVTIEYDVGVDKWYVNVSHTAWGGVQFGNGDATGISCDWSTRKLTGTFTAAGAGVCEGCTFTGVLS